DHEEVEDRAVVLGRPFLGRRARLELRPGRRVVRLGRIEVDRLYNRRQLLHPVDPGPPVRHDAEEPPAGGEAGSFARLGAAIAAIASIAALPAIKAGLDR